MFKKRGRQNINRRVRQTEESSEEEPVILRGNRNGKSNDSQINQESTTDSTSSSNHNNRIVNSSTTSNRLSQKSKIQSGFFSSNKPKFTQKVDLKKNYDDIQATDGIDSMKPKDIEIHVDDIKKLEKEIEKKEDSDMELEEGEIQPPEDFIPIHNTKNLRSLLRQRNQMSSSDEDEPDENTMEIDDLSVSSSDEEARWERHLVERGISGPVIHHSATEETTQYLQPQEVYSIVSQEHVIKRLSNVLNDLRLNYDENIHIISTTEKEIEELEQEEQHDYGNRLKTEQRYDFYQKETYFFRKLSGYLTDKKQELEIDYANYLKCIQQYKWSNDYINRLYLLDDISYLSQLQAIETIVNEVPEVIEKAEIQERSGPFYKGDIYYEKDFTQTRMGDRSLYIDNINTIHDSIQEIMIQDQVYNCITVPIDYYLSNCIFYNYNDQTTDQYIQQLCIYLLFQWTYLIAIHRQKILDIFEAKALRLMSLEEVLKHFQQWREEYPEDYENAYISLSIDDFIPVILFPSLIQYDPLELQEEGGIHSIQEFSWYSTLKQFCETTNQQRDTLLLPRFIQKHVISFLNNIILYEWNPLSIHESTLLQKALIEIASYFNTVINELRDLYASVTQRIQQTIQSAVYFIPSLLSEQTNDIQTDAQEMTEYYLTRGIRLLEVINTLASFMTLGTPAPCIDNLVTCLCCYLKGMVKQPCLVQRCREFAIKINELIPPEVISAKQEIQIYL